METQINPKRTTFRAKNLERRVLLHMTLSKNWRTFGKRTRKTPALFVAEFSRVIPSHFCTWNAANNIKPTSSLASSVDPEYQAATCNIRPPQKAAFPSHIDHIHKWRPRNYPSLFVLIIICAYHPHKPHLKVKILLNFVRANEVRGL